MSNRDYLYEAKKALTAPAVEPTREQIEVEMVAMFLCDSMIIPLGANSSGSRSSGGHGWHRTSTTEREEYRRRAKKIYESIDKTRIAD